MKLSHKKLSSYNKGIQNLLKNEELFDEIICEYVVRVNAKYYSTIFPSSQIAKIIMDKMDKEKTKFPIIHKVVREILNKWVDRDICKFVSEKRKHKIKTVVEFDQEGLNKLKRKILDFSIDKINEGIKDLEIEVDSLKTRGDIFKEMELEIQDFFNFMEEE